MLLWYVRSTVDRGIYARICSGYQLLDLVSHSYDYFIDVICVQKKSNYVMKRLKCINTTSFGFGLQEFEEIKVESRLEGVIVQ